MRFHRFGRWLIAHRARIVARRAREVKSFVHAHQKKVRTLRSVKKHRGELIREAREAAGWSQAQLADVVGLHPSMISKIEKGGVFLEPDTFNQFTRALRSLSPLELAIANGYELAAPSAMTLPVQLVRDLLAMSAEELDATALLVHRATAGNRLQGA